MEMVYVHSKITVPHVSLISNPFTDDILRLTMATCLQIAHWLDMNKKIALHIFDIGNR